MNYVLVYDAEGATDDDEHYLGTLRLTDNAMQHIKNGSLTFTVEYEEETPSLLTLHKTEANKK